MLTITFLNIFLQTLAITCGILTGLSLVFIAVVLVLLILYPITKKFKK